MASEEAAVTMVNYYASATPTVRNWPVYVQFSNHRELKTDNLPNHTVRQGFGSAHFQRFILKLKIYFKNFI